MTTNELAAALGHVRNAVWQLMGNDETRGIILGLECLDLEALLNPDDHEPAVVPLEPDAAASLAAARRLLEPISDRIAPAAWATLQSLRSKLG